MRKAGSASLQSFLTANEHALREVGIDYPRIGRAKRFDHNNLASDAMGRSKFDWELGGLTDLSDYWRSSSCEVLAISGEMFEECETRHIARLIDVLGGEPADFRIVVVLRDLVSLIPSSYAQKIKYGARTHDFDAFFAERMAHRRVDYFQTAARWAEAVGWENLRVRVLDRAQLLNGDLVDDFLDIAGAPPGLADSEGFKRPGVINSAPGWKVLEAVRSLYAGEHGFEPDHPFAEALSHTTSQKRHVGMIAEALGDRWDWNADKGLYLTQAQAEACVAVHRRSIEALNGALSKPLPMPAGLAERGFIAREFLPDFTHIPTRELQAFLQELADASVSERRRSRKHSFASLREKKVTSPP